MNRARMLAEAKEVLNDAEVDGVIGEQTLLGYLAEGQDEFCERTGYFRDKTNFSITLATDTSEYSIPDRVYQIIDIWDGTSRLEKVLTGETIEESSAAGPPNRWQTDTETGQIKLDPTPTSDENGDTLTLQVWCYSLIDLAADGGEPEIPSQFHRACIEWAMYKAFNHHDMETQDPVKAADHYASFKHYVRRGKRAFRNYHNQQTRVGTDQAYKT